MPGLFAVYSDYCYVVKGTDLKIAISTLCHIMLAVSMMTGGILVPALC